MLRKKFARWPITRSANRSSAAPILDEATFKNVLSVERKRTERSRRGFVMMLLHCGTLLTRANGSGNGIINEVISALLHATRETDTKGWYSPPCVLGVIFTEIEAPNANVAVNILLNRVTSVLASALTPEQLRDIQLSFHVYPEDSGGGQGTLVDLRLYPDLLSRSTENSVGQMAKRVLDVTLSMFALVVLSPLLLAIAVLVKLTSAGPILFRQERVGQYGMLFTFLKFRTMHVATDSAIHQQYVQRLITRANTDGSAAVSERRPIYKLISDPRITSFGRVLRRSSLDELPQLLNVLVGTMSLVGPRPPIPYEVEYYDTWHRARLLAVKPGITGLWQVGGRSRTTFDEMVRLDMQYARTWSLWLDVKILLRTPRAVLSREGAY